MEKKSNRRNWANCGFKLDANFVASKIILLNLISLKKMKTLGKLKLNEFRKAELEKRELNTLKGGCSCKCACAGGWDYTNANDGGENGAGRAY